MLIGYGRISTAHQDLALQRGALEYAGREKVFEDVKFGSRADRPGLLELLKYARNGDVLVV